MANKQPQDGTHGEVARNLLTAFSVIAGAAGILLAYKAVPDFARRASTPSISLLTLVAVVVVSVLVVTGISTLSIQSRKRLLRQQSIVREDLERQSEAVADELKRRLGAARDGISNQLDAERAKNANLLSLLKDLHIAAYYDMLTGVPNSRYLERLLDETAGPRCLILLDLHDFRSINKKFGHWKGDAYLARFATIVTEEMRRNEHVMKVRKPAELEDPELIRRSSGADEFYVFLRGSVADGLGYLRRLLGLKVKIDAMSADLLGEVHPFAFRAGVVPILDNDTLSLATGRASQALLKTVGNPTSFVYWDPDDTKRAVGRDAETVDLASKDFLRTTPLVPGAASGA